MELLAFFIDFVLHLDTHLLALTQEYGVWVYGILFLIIFSETGLVVVRGEYKDGREWATQVRECRFGEEPDIVLQAAGVIGVANSP